MLSGSHEYLLTGYQFRVYKMETYERIVCCLRSTQSRLPAQFGPLLWDFYSVASAGCIYMCSYTFCTARASCHRSSVCHWGHPLGSESPALYDTPHVLLFRCKIIFGQLIFVVSENREKIFNKQISESTVSHAKQAGLQVYSIYKCV